MRTGSPREYDVQFGFEFRDIRLCGQLPDSFRQPRPGLPASQLLIHHVCRRQFIIFSLIAFTIPGSKVTSYMHISNLKMSCSDFSCFSVLLVLSLIFCLVPDASIVYPILIYFPVCVYCAESSLPTHFMSAWTNVHGHNVNRSY